jgi:hypothetical protein
VIGIANRGGSACALQGYLAISIPASGSRFEPVEIVHGGILGPAGFEKAGDAYHPSSVVLAADDADAAWVGVRWSNQCGPAPTETGMELVLSEGGELPISSQPKWIGSGCSDPSGSWVLEEGPVQLPLS